ncbi:MAG: hypothetical protein ONB24_13265 [candidate division KSB1 bacterium]|nr:hypothetical protein [candidate division KSB1 bacterium]
MKKFVLLTFCLLTTAELYSQGRSQIVLQSGYLKPRDTSSGMMFGAMFFSPFDEAVDLGFGADVFQRSYADETEVVETIVGGTTVSTQRTLVDYTRTAIPVYLTVKIKIPAVRSLLFGYFVRANLSYQFLISKEKNYREGKSETRNYQGLGWQASAGLFYRLGSRSTLIGEALYNNCVVSRDVKTPTEALPLTERVNLSGLGMRIGLELDLR